MCILSSVCAARWCMARGIGIGMVIDRMGSEIDEGNRSFGRTHDGRQHNTTQPNSKRDGTAHTERVWRALPLCLFAWYGVLLCVALHVRVVG